jgi:hypothetical protein
VTGCDFTGTSGGLFVRSFMETPELSDDVF